MNVILVDPKDKPIGVMDKMAAHKKGVLHRAFSIFVFNSRGELLLQKRAGSKYHSGSLWTNTCCSHPGESDQLIDYAKKRLKEEMGFTCGLSEKFSFIYRAELDKGLIEHEYDHVLVGNYDSDPRPDPKEVEDWRWARLEDIDREIRLKPQDFTEWFKICLPRFLS